jgi:hypothetical protein
MPPLAELLGGLEVSTLTGQVQGSPTPAMWRTAAAQCVNYAIPRANRAVGRMGAAGTTLASVRIVLDFQWLTLTDLWCRAIDVHDLRPLTWSAALAAHAVGREDLRRLSMGIPSIFELPPPPPAVQLRGSP